MLPTIIWEDKHNDLKQIFMAIMIMSINDINVNDCTLQLSVVG